MTEKKEIQDFYLDVLKKNKVCYKRENPRLRKKQTTNFPDVVFVYKGIYYFREFGIKGRHMDRKTEQYKYMKKVYDNAPKVTNIAIIFSREAAELDLVKIGLIKKN